MKVHRNCCGLDVHKQTIAACLIREDASGNTCKEKRLFGTMTRDLRELANWLREAAVSAVAMEATGVYWVPVWNVLEREPLQLLLINPEHYKAIRGKKTDLKDGERIAELLQDGRLEGSYVPSTDLRVIRDLTRIESNLWNTNPLSLAGFRSCWSNATSNWLPSPAMFWALAVWRCYMHWPTEKPTRNTSLIWPRCNCARRFQPCGSRSMVVYCRTIVFFCTRC